MQPLARGFSIARSAGFLALLAGVGAAAALSARHLGAAALPGCGLESACDRALGSPWAVLPLARWPIAFLGAAWFLGLGGAWLVARRGWPRACAWLARAGALGSLVLLGAMLQEGALCPYCLVVHAASLTFLVASEVAARAPGPARLPLLVFGAAALGATLALLPPWLRHERQLSEQDERELEAATQALVSPDPQEARTPAPFTGRYRLGPEDAPLRLVLFFDYQCRDCARIEGEAMALLERRADLSLSVRHYPLCSDCNRRARELGANPHPEACRAARAAEAAGMMGGEQAFWAMHRHLFERGGVFRESDAEALARLGLERTEFLAAFAGAESQRRVEADVEAALALGITSTPLVFLNGVELRGWRAPRALERAVEALAATNPPRATADGDRPPSALEKCLEDWRIEREVRLPPPGRAGPRELGEERAKGEQEVVVWGDYLDPASRELDRKVREVLGAGRAGLYSFRHFPLDPACDASVPALRPGACLAARAAEAAFALGGEQVFRAFHARLMESQDPPGAEGLARLAAELGLDRDAFLAALTAQATLDSVRADIASARHFGVTSIPALFVARKRVPRWRLEGEPLVERILDEGLAGR